MVAGRRKENYRTGRSQDGIVIAENLFARNLYPGWKVLYFVLYLTSET